MKSLTHKNKLSFIFLFFILSNLNTQLYGQNSGIGLKTGLEISTQLNNFQFASQELQLDLKPEFTNGYNLGLIFRRRITANFRTQAEPTFIKLGARYNESFVFRGFNFETNSEINLSYLQLPIIFAFTSTPLDMEEFPKPWEGTTYHGIIGFYGSYLLDAQFIGTNSGTPIGVDFEEEFSEDVTQRFNTFDAGLLLGAGFEHGYLNKMGMEARLFLGLIDTTNPDQSEFKPNNLSISLAVYYIF